MSKVLWIIILIIVVVALYNTFTQSRGSFKFEHLSSIIKLPGGINVRTSSTVPVPVQGTNQTSKINPVPADQKPPESIKPAIVPPVGFSVNQLSPYYGQVEIGYPSQGSSYNPSQFSLRSNYSLGSPIDITGWTLKSNKGTLSIPRAVSDFDPSGLASDGDIVLNESEYVNFYSNFSPVGYGLRLNECTGYLNNTYKFNPTLPSNCPSMYNRSDIATFSGLCQSLILSMWGCSVPSPDQINSVPDNEGSCRSFLTNRFNYRGCYNYHRSDANFFSKEWRVWLRSQMNFDWDHDRLLLFDRAGLLVDEYVY